MAKSFVTTRGRKTVRWSTLPAENEMLSHDLLLAGNNTTDYSDMLLLECVRTVLKNDEKTKVMAFLLSTNVKEFRGRAEFILKKYNNKVEVEGFKKFVEPIKRYIWKELGYKSVKAMDIVSKIFFGMGHYDVVNVPNRSDLIMASEEDIRNCLHLIGVPMSELSHLHSIMLRTSYWIEDSGFKFKDTMCNEITRSRLIWLDKYPLEELVLLGRVAFALGRRELNLYQKLTVASNIVYGVPLSTLRMAHDKGELYKTRPMEKILDYPRYYNHADQLIQICNYITNHPIIKE